MADIFQRMGINTAGGQFIYPEQKDIDPYTKANILTQLRANFQLPVSDEYLYEEFGIEKPADYDTLKAEQQKNAAPCDGVSTPPSSDEPSVLPPNKNGDPDPNNTPKPTPKQKKSFKSWLRSFFAKAPHHSGAALEW